MADETTTPTPNEFETAPDSAPAPETSPPAAGGLGSASDPAAAGAAVATPEAPEAQAGPSGPRELGEGQHWFWGTGRRKSSVARARLRPGEGKLTINEREVNAYFTELIDRQDAWAPLEATNTAGALEVHVNVKGGGPTGQGGAVRLAIARALEEYDPSLQEVLRQKGFLTVDSRQVERKKYGQPGARRRFQFSKR